MSQAVKHIAPSKTHKNDRICVIVPAAGSTMKSSGPKCLMKIGHKSFFEHQQDVLAFSFPNYYTVLVAGFDAQNVMDNTPSCIKIENQRFDETTVLKSISMGLRASLCDKVLIMYGDVLCSKETLHFDYMKSAVFLDKTIDNDTVGSFCTNGKIEQLMYGLEHKWGQILYLTGKELELFKKFAFKGTADKQFPFEVINKVIESGGQFLGLTNPHSKIRDMDCAKDIKSIQELVHENCL